VKGNKTMRGQDRRGGEDGWQEEGYGSEWVRRGGEVKRKLTKCEQNLLIRNGKTTQWDVLRCVSPENPGMKPGDLGKNSWEDFD